MSKKETFTEPITNNEVTRMWYRDRLGNEYAVVKYADPYGLNKKAEEVPIYVAAAGEQPRELGEVLEELKRIKDYKYHQEESYINQLEVDINLLTARLESIENKSAEPQKKRKWWR